MNKILIIIAIIFLNFSTCLFSAEILNGKILAINNEHNFVIINLGKKDKVKKGMVFLVYREKKLIGKVEAEDVYKDMTSCVMLPWMTNEDFKIDDGVLKP